MSIDTSEVSLGDELWTWQHLARYLHRSRNAVFKLVNEPTFPAAVVVAGDRLWVGTEVKAWVLASRAQGQAIARPAAPRGGGRALSLADAHSSGPSGSARRGRPRHV